MVEPERKQGVSKDLPNLHSGFERSPNSKFQNPNSDGLWRAYPPDRLKDISLVWQARRLFLTTIFLAVGGPSYSRGPTIWDLATPI